mgnify:FL=1
MAQITPVTSLPARNASVAGQVTALGSNVRFYATLTAGSAAVSLIQQLQSGDWDYVMLPGGSSPATLTVNASAGTGTTYMDVPNLNSGSIYAVLASTPVPSTMRAYIYDLVDPAAGEYSGPAFSTTLPAEVGATLSYGSASTAARSDHVHTLGSDALSAFNGAGAFTTLSASTSLTLGSNAGLTGGTGTGALALSGMNGPTALPTGNLTWNGASTKTLTLAASGAAAVTSSAGALTLTGGAASVWSTSAGALTITSAAAATWSTAAGALGIDSAAGLNLGTSSATALTVGRSAATVTYASKQAAGATTNIITDPGNAGAIPVTTDGVCALTSAGAETRTLAIPTFAGQILCLCFDTDGGDVVVTSAQAINQTGNNTLTFNDAGDALTLIAITVGGARRWRVLHNDGVTLSTV